MVVVLRNYASKDSKVCYILDVLSTDMSDNEYTIFRENDCVSIPINKKVMEGLSCRSENDDYQHLYGAIFKSNMTAKELNKALSLTESIGFYDVESM